MRLYFLYFFFFSFFTAFSQQNNFVHRDGKILRDSTGSEIKLRGVNLGGWLLWEEWIWGGGFHSQTHMLDEMTKLVGAAETKKFEENVYRTFITEADIKQIAALGFNVVRVPFNHKLFDIDEPHAKIGWKLLDDILRWCKKYGVYAVLDMHGAPGGQSPYFISDPQKPNLWKVDSLQTKTAHLWYTIAGRYKNNPVVAGYDLLNEPIPGDPKKLLALYEHIIGDVREQDNNHLLFIEGINFAKNFDMFKSLPDEKMVFEFHLYTWFGGEPGKKIGPFITLQERLNVPVWCGEWGENTNEVLKHTREVYETASFSGWCMWTWKKVVNKYPALCEIKSNEAWTKLIKHIQKPKAAPAPTKEEALKGMNEFLEAIQFNNCVMNSEMGKILQGK